MNKNGPISGLNTCFDLKHVRLFLSILPGTQIFQFCSNAAVPFAINQTHLKYFKWPRSAAIVSHILQFIAVFHSPCVKEKQGAMQKPRSRDLSHSFGGLCRGLLISKRHEETGWGESWSRPQIAPLGATAAATMVVCGEASEFSVHDNHQSDN